MGKKSMVKLLVVLSAAYPHFELSEETAELYCKMLADVDRQSLQVAIKNHIETSKYFPTIAELRQRAEAANVRLRTGYGKFLDTSQEVKKIEG